MVSTGRWLVAVIVAATLGLGATAQAQPPTPDPTPERAGPPSSIAVLGDSISTATGAHGPLGAERPQHSWSTGTTASVNSNYLRLRELNPAINGRNHNLAANGQRMVHMAQQAARLPADTEYVQVQLGGNDLCRPTVGEMTPVETYRAQFVAGLEAITEQAPDALIGVTSIPDIYNLWYIRYAPASVNGQQSNQASQARSYVNLSIIPCLSLLENPASTDPADEARRQEVRARNLAFNEVLAEECAKVLRCRFDGHATFNFSSNRAEPPFGPILPRDQWQFTDLDISRNASGLGGALCPLTGLLGNDCGDHFHPSLQGQQKLSEVAWETLYDFSDTTAPDVSFSTDPAPPSAGWHNGAVTVRIDAADDVAVRGIEHRVHRADGTVTDWTPVIGDAAEVVVDEEGVTHVEARALDVNGNLGASSFHTVRADLTAPTISIDSPVAEVTYTLGGAVDAGYTCDDEPGGSGLATCGGDVADGDPIDTSTVGANSFTVTAADNAGNEATAIVEYRVVYDFGGFGAPLAGDEPHTVRAPATLPVKFTLTDADGQPVPTAHATVSMTASGADHPSLTSGPVPYDATDQQYVLPVSTRDLTPGDYTLTVHLDDGTEHSTALVVR